MILYSCIACNERALQTKTMNDGRKHYIPFTDDSSYKDKKYNCEMRENCSIPFDHCV